MKHCGLALYHLFPKNTHYIYLYFINHCKSTTSTTPTTISANLWQPMPGRLCDPFSSSTPLAPPSSREWWNGPPSQTEWKNWENQHLQAERGHKPWMSIKKARDVVGYNVKNNFVNTSQNRTFFGFCSHFVAQTFAASKNEDNAKI